jgi:N utilization substance protein A
MARESIIDVLGDIARDKGISRDRLQEVIQEAVTAAAKRKFKDFSEIEARINTNSGELEVFRYKRVTEELVDPENEIPLDEARKLDSLAEPGDEVEYEIDNQELSRVIAQTARQLIFQKIREAERETIYENFKDRKGEILNGIVSRTERNRIFVTFNQVEAILYRREQIPNERYSSGEHIRVILLDVLNDPKEPSQLVVSRADPLLLIKLFEMEVPEIYDGIVEIVTAAREAGRRAKIAVRSNDQDVDPVGACVGMRGSRVQSIISELRGEKIDIISWSDELPTYIANSLAPAELTRIRIDEENEEIDVEVEPDQLSLAIGRQGQNVRLASKLLGYKVNINSTQDKALTLEEQIRERLLASQAQLAGHAPGEVEEGAPGEGLTPEDFAAAEAAAGAEAAGETVVEPVAGEMAPGEPPAGEAGLMGGEEMPPEAAAETVPEAGEEPPAMEAPPAEEGTVAAEMPAEELPGQETPLAAEETAPAADEAPAMEAEAAAPESEVAPAMEAPPAEEGTVAAEMPAESPGQEAPLAAEGTAPAAEEAPAMEAEAAAPESEVAPAMEAPPGETGAAGGVEVAGAEEEAPAAEEDESPEQRGESGTE